MTLVVFDLDGTLVESHNETDYFYALNATLVHFGLKEMDLREYKSLDLWNGRGYEGVGAKLGLSWSSFDIRYFFEVFDQIYPRCFRKALKEKQVKLYNDVIPALALLKKHGHQIAILTNSGKAGAELKLKELGLSDLVDMLVTNDDCKPKPNPCGLFLLADTFEVQLENVLFVGDSHVDREASQIAGVEFIHIMRSKDQSISSGNSISSLLDLLDINECV